LDGGVNFKTETDNIKKIIGYLKKHYLFITKKLAWQIVFVN